MEGIYKFHWDIGRRGDVHGIFTADSEDIKKAIGMNVYFGEILGEDLEICGELKKKDFILLTQEQSVIDIFDEYGFSSGYNPLDYLESNE